MADYKDRMKDYVEVPERIAEFYLKYPDGSLQSEIVEHIPGRWVERTFHDKNDHPYQATVRSDGLITVKAWAYRTPDDPRPGIGHSWLEIPGTTPYTETSELENAETSAWGRALAALGIATKKSIASADEIRNKQRAPRTEAQPQPTQPPRPAPGPANPAAPCSEQHTKALWASCRARAKQLGLGDNEAYVWLEREMLDLGVPPGEDGHPSGRLMKMGQYQKILAKVAIAEMGKSPAESFDQAQ